jgi:hypothetical protein
MSMIGKTLGNFILEAQIGKGGMGEVYRAKDQKLGRDVAIKVLPQEFAKDIDRVARFQREAEGPRKIDIVLNWFEELKEWVPAERGGQPWKHEKGNLIPRVALFIRFPLHFSSCVSSGVYKWQNTAKRTEFR